VRALQQPMQKLFKRNLRNQCESSPDILTYPSFSASANTTCRAINVLRPLQNTTTVTIGIVDKAGFNVQLNTLYVISGMILQIRWLNQQCHSIQGLWLALGQSHQAQLTKTWSKNVTNKFIAMIWLQDIFSQTKCLKQLKYIHCV